MCYTIYIKESGKEIETPNDFFNHFGIIPQKSIHHKYMCMDCCLCQCDIELSLKKLKIKYEKISLDYYI